MTRKRNPEEIPVEELRRLLVEKRRAARHERLERFRRTGRAVTIAPEQETAPLKEYLVEADEYESEVQPSSQVSPRRRFFDRALLVVEILAVVGLALILLNGLGILNELNA